MFREKLRLSSNGILNELLLGVLGALLLVVFGPLEVFTESSLPITLQSLFVVTIPVMIGWRAGLFSVLLYLVLGFAGVPVFVGYSSGLDKLFGPTGGFLIGFAAAALVAGFIAEQAFKKWRLQALLALFAGHVIILGLGLPWFWRMIVEDEPLKKLLYYFGPISLIKLAFGFLLVQVVHRVMEGRNK